MKKESKKIVVLIPCYNESKTIAKVKYSQYIKKQDNATYT